MAEDKNKTATAEAAKADESKDAKVNVEQEAKAEADKTATAEAAKADDKKDKTTKTKAGKFTVASEFRDISDFDKIHKVGDDVSSFDKERLVSLVKRGLVKKS